MHQFDLHRTIRRIMLCISRMTACMAWVYRYVMTSLAYDDTVSNVLAQSALQQQVDIKLT